MSDKIGGFTFEPVCKLGESISVQKMTGNGQVYFRITKLYKEKETSEWKPTKQGVSVPLERCQELYGALGQFIKENPIQSTPGVSDKVLTTGSDIVADLEDI